ncbi:hypothetical protein FLACHUCJ7_02043 [Flavobacterium chungangense]|uniref:Uncharacterized protein n=1 Tax=Flavobacterium chungangense TaxID=554283 RepID=A0A6V6YZH6_9FLAO|nr:hypothetical protein FLACHUCJ7_02043 [Flavobacterium chungangense]
MKQVRIIVNLSKRAQRTLFYKIVTIFFSIFTLIKNENFYKETVKTRHDEDLMVYNQRNV